MLTTRNRQTSALRWIPGIAAFSIALLCAGCAGNASRPAPADAHTGAKKQVQAVIQTDDPDPADADRLDKAMQMIVAGESAKAIQGPIAKVLAHFPAQSEKGDTRYFSAVTPMEAILYAGIDEGKHGHIVVMPGEWVTALFLEGFAYNGMQMYDAAHHALARGAALAPFNAHLLNELGYTCEKQKNWKQALDIFKNAASAADFLDGKKKISEKSRALRGQGYVLVELGKLDEAEAVYHSALKLDPGDTRSMGELEYIRRLRAHKH